jgi:hypothetical protein
MIPEEALKAALEAVQNETYGASYSRDLVRIALTTAAPLIRAQALEDAAEWQTELLGNPYFNSAQRDRLRWRAVTERGGE